MAKIIAICGKICAGKTYYANRLKARESAVILSCDELTKMLFDNDLGDRHDDMARRIHAYLLQKAAELTEAGCTVILDWGFWSRADRSSLTVFCQKRNLPVEWHYVDVDDQTWRINIDERNRRITDGECGSDYYLDEGLMRKLLARWEPPADDEIDIWYKPKQ